MKKTINNKKFFLITAGLIFCLVFLKTNFLAVLAVSPSPAPLDTAEEATSSSTEDEKVKEIRDAIKEKVNEIKEKIEKRAYVGTINQITDSTLTLENFRGKKRVRLTEETTIIATNKKEIKQNELALEDKVIAMGIMGGNEILEAVRVVVVPKPSVTPPEKVISLGTITSVNSKTSRLTLSSANNPDNEIEIKVEKETKIKEQSSLESLKFLELKQDQKIIVIYPKPKQGSLPLASSIFVLQ
ncbi:hypothetical protein C4578_01655 [Candidatus Microgenomates bacterium]|jgi:hypothetical protein|nr:MAG: hypothetical protein C4578_01655 [Candidatus Microgenomates bacterium]